MVHAESASPESEQDEGEDSAHDGDELDDGDDTGNEHHELEDIKSISKGFVYHNMVLQVIIDFKEAL